MISNANARAIARVEFSESLREWIIVIDDTGYRHYFDCKAEAEEYLRLCRDPHLSPYVWRRLGQWCVTHKHDEHCSPNWMRGKP